MSHDRLWTTTGVVKKECACSQLTRIHRLMKLYMGVHRFSARTTTSTSGRTIVKAVPSSNYGIPCPEKKEW